MKKLISVFTAMILILTSVCAVSASEQNEAEQLCLNKFTEYLQDNPYYFPGDGLPVSIDYIGEINGYYACIGEYGAVMTRELGYRLENYVFEANGEYAYTEGDIKLPILFVNENECLPFGAAYEQGIFTAEELAELLAAKNIHSPVSAFKAGDADKNGVINVTDATAVQKHLADTEVFSKNQALLADVDCDGKIDIRDATEIQKYSSELIQKLG